MASDFAGDSDHGSHHCAAGPVVAVKRTASEAELEEDGMAVVTPSGKKHQKRVKLGKSTRQGKPASSKCKKEHGASNDVSMSVERMVTARVRNKTSSAMTLVDVDGENLAMQEARIRAVKLVTSPNH